MNVSELVKVHIYIRGVRISMGKFQSGFLKKHIRKSVKKIRFFFWTWSQIADPAHPPRTFRTFREKNDAQNDPKYDIIKHVSPKV